MKDTEKMDEPFTTRMKKATRSIHSISDALVQAKFAIALQDKQVWGEGLYSFYHIFSFLEDARDRLNMPDYNSLYVAEELLRASEIREDLFEYLGANWVLIPKTPAVENYLLHLENLEKDNPRLLMVYVYHLYLGLLSGGQILAKKRMMFDDGSLSTGVEKYIDRVAYFKHNDIGKLKKDLKAAMERIAEKMTPREQDEFINESIHLFLMNNLVINSVPGQDMVLKKFICKVSAVVIAVAGVAFAYTMHK
ncbi:heme oxygenase 1 [Amyelois transitella]|uniref:heme oxygenase 1 n=1 Tax=Amyelois transitella TaxID=680683 RepID=UPI00067D55A4|nr:heme oxygenase 1 [Amyelois transitella]